MSNAIFPSGILGLAYTVTKTAEYSTVLQSSASKNEIRTAQYQNNPIWTFQLLYEVLKDRGVLSPYAYSEYRTLQGFFLARKGRFDDFLFTDPTDFVVGPDVWQPNKIYLPGQTIIDPGPNVTSPGHAQVAQLWGTSGSTAPTFNDIGGSTPDNGQLWSDNGVASSTLGQVLQILTDSNGNPYAPLTRNFGGQYYENITDLFPTNVPGPPPTIPNAVFWFNGNPVAQYYLSGVIVGPTIPFTYRLPPSPPIPGLALLLNWQPATDFGLNQVVIDSNGHFQIAASSVGTTGSSPPAWNSSGGTTTDNTVTWQDLGP